MSMSKPLQGKLLVTFCDLIMGVLSQAKIRDNRSALKDMDEVFMLSGDQIEASEAQVETRKMPLTPGILASEH